MINLLLNTRDLVHAAAHELVGHLFPGAAVYDQPLTDTPTCAVPHCRRPATVGRLCGTGTVDRDDVEDGGHFAQLGRWLHDIQNETGRLNLDPDDPDAWPVLPSTSTRWDRSGGAALASQRAPAVLDPLALSDPRTTAQGHLHIGPLCRRCPGLLAQRCSCPPLPWRRAAHYASCRRSGMHSSCLDILLDRDEHGADQPVYALGVLTALAQRVRDERLLGQSVESFTDCMDRSPDTPLHGPAYGLPCLHESCRGISWQRTIPIPPTIASERRLLTRNLDWIAAQDWVLAAREQIADLRDQLMRVNRNQDDRPLAGYCYKHIDDQGTECRGNLWPVYAAYDSDDDGEARLQPREVVCDRNPTHRWKGGRGGDLARLSLILEQQRRGTPSDAAGNGPASPLQQQKPASATPPPLRSAGGRLHTLILEQRAKDAAS